MGLERSGSIRAAIGSLCLGIVGTVLALMASGAAARVYGHFPKTGPWRGQTVDQTPVSFRVTKHGRRFGNFVIQVDYTCTDPGTGAPVPGGELTLTERQPVPVKSDLVGGFAIYNQEITVSVPGDSVPETFGVDANFTSHKPSGAATIASGAVIGHFSRDNGDYCVLGRDEGSVAWRAKPRRGKRSER